MNQRHRQYLCLVLHFQYMVIVFLCGVTEIFVLAEVAKLKIKVKTFPGLCKKKAAISGGFLDQVKINKFIEFI